jgi:hypothetical protein
MRRRVRALILMAMALAAGSGCARAMIVETDRQALASIEVRNETGVTMIVSYDGAATTRATLGAVTSGATERFIITLPAGTEIRVSGVSENGARISGPHSVTLQSGSTARVTLR